MGRITFNSRTRERVVTVASNATNDTVPVVTGESYNGPCGFRDDVAAATHGR